MGSGLFGKVAGDRGQSVATRQGNRVMTAGINSDDVEVQLRVHRTGVSTDDGTVEVEVSIAPLGIGWIPSRVPTVVMVGEARVNGNGDLEFVSTRTVGGQ